MHVVIADQLSSSAIEILHTVPGFTVDARPGRTAAELAKDLADADALVVRSATQVDAMIAAAPRLIDCPRGHGRTTMMSPPRPIAASS